MHLQEYLRMYQREGDYWWFVARRRLARALMQAYVPSLTGRLLDAGCGTGALLHELSQLGCAVGVDIEPAALRLTRQRGALTVVQARLEALPFVSEAFQVTFALDVLEHLPDERPALRELYRVLQPGGYLILSAPAYRWLWSKHDLALAHYRRYTARALRTRLSEAGFQVRKLSYSLTFLLPLIALARWLDWLRPGAPAATVVPVPRWLNDALVRLQDWESRLMTRLNLPFGVSLVAVCQKPAPLSPPVALSDSVGEAKVCSPSREGTNADEVQSCARCACAID
ncbi:MAG: class I SAM-dependent methyltransferase [Fimbriimonadales bacterium]|nr:class I SAM-dependent methyltransferase [Fimbriimonadales bacterium]